MGRFSILGLVKKVAFWLVLAGLGFALLRAFDGDVVAVLRFIGDKIVGAIRWVADLFSNNETFRESVKPK